MLNVCPERADRGLLVSVVYRPITALHVNTRNARTHSKRQVRQIAASIKEFGFNVPVLVDRDLKVIAGHGRLLACRELGWSEVPTIGLDHLSDAQARAFMIADNRLTEIAKWDDGLLAKELEELSRLKLDFSIELTGFEVGEIDRLRAAAEEPGLHARPPILTPAVELA